MRRSHSRRAALGLMAAAPALAALPASAAPRSRSFRIIRDGSDIGSHRIEVSDAPLGGLLARTEIDIAVKVLGLTAYRYALRYEEAYRDGLLQRFSSVADDDGDDAFAKATADPAGLAVEGTSFVGVLPATAVPTSYWRRAALEAAPDWFSAQSGEPLGVSVAPMQGGPEMPKGSSAFLLSGKDDYAVEVWYDASGEWTGCAFDGRGERVHYVLEPGSTRLVRS